MNMRYAFPIVKKKECEMHFLFDGEFGKAQKKSAGGMIRPALKCGISDRSRLTHHNN
jgi:hypothetical protein